MLYDDVYYKLHISTLTNFEGYFIGLVGACVHNKDKKKLMSSKVKSTIYYYFSNDIQAHGFFLVSYLIYFIILRYIKCSFISSFRLDLF